MYFSGRNLPAFVSAVSNIVSDKYLYVPNCGNEAVVGVVFLDSPVAKLGRGHFSFHLRVNTRL